MKHSILGIIGGLGPETSAMFCIDVNRMFMQHVQGQPHLVMDNLPISRAAERRLITGGASQEHLSLLEQSVARLSKAGCTQVAIPCNTVHTFIRQLRKISPVPILSIIEETAETCKRLRLGKAGVLASTRTMQDGLFTRELAKRQIGVVAPDAREQAWISGCIIRIIHNRTRRDDKGRMRRIMRKLQRAGAEGIILGCTDLPLLISPQDSGIPIVNALEALERAAVKSLLRGGGN
ncbi:MAG TPA: amino acid racemase [Candidatus Nanoarchaeia archaeon]|nr:amino acid racemase [Candidatus Nanoarchaeia archaeon]